MSKEVPRLHEMSLAAMPRAIQTALQTLVDKLELRARHDGGTFQVRADAYEIDEAFRILTTAIFDYHHEANELQPYLPLVSFHPEYKLRQLLCDPARYENWERGPKALEDRLANNKEISDVRPTE